MAAPKVFISYSHDTNAHKDWVLRLASDLRSQGIDAVLDQWDLSPGQDIVGFMAGGIRSADRVLLICTDMYVSKAEAGTGGVGYERLVVTAEVVGSIDTVKFIPIVRNNASARKVPHFLGPRVYIDFSDESQYAAKLEQLAREIWGAPALAKPPLGENPFKGEVIEASEPVRVAGPSGTTSAGVPILNSEWFQTQHATASAGLAKLSSKLTGAMELRFALHNGLNKTQIELRNAVGTSEIKTFGWPIGVVLENENHPEHWPRPFGDGIQAEVALDNGRTSYDYWAVRKSGDFYLLQSLFEDTRDKDALFFNTRIVRVTEALMFASRLYSALGAAADAKISLRVTHTGLSGRTLKKRISEQEALHRP
jgi:TIR domain